MDERATQLIPPTAVPVLPYAGEFDPSDPVAFANGPFLVVRKGASLPDRCVKCNESTHGRPLSRQFLWTDAGDNPAGGRLRVVPILRIVFAFVSMFRWFTALRTLRSAEIRLGVCGHHRRLAAIYLLIGVLVVPLAVAIAVLSHNEYVWIWSMVGGITIAGFALNASRLVHPVHVGITHVTLKGVCRAYLQSLDEKKITGKLEPPAVDQLLSSVSALKHRIEEHKKRM